MPDTSTVAFQPHAIQLKHIGVKELYIRANVPPSQSVDTSSIEYGLFNAYSEYFSESHMIRAGVKLEAGIAESEEELPFAIRVEIYGDFFVDESRFDVNLIEKWADGNAPFILYPYLREHVFALTARSGFPPVLLDLVEVPTWNKTQP